MKESDLVLFKQVNDSIIVLLDDRILAPNHLRDIQAQALDFNAMVCKVLARMLVIF